MRCRPCLLALLFVTAPAAAKAQNVVTLCESDAQSGAGRNLKQALSIGGQITFACPGPNVSIRITAGHAVPAGVTIDGGGRVTLDAHGSLLQLFDVASGSFTMRNLTVQNVGLRTGGAFPPRASVLVAGGDATLEGVTVQGSTNPVLIRGNGRVVGSRFLANPGRALTIQSEALVENSDFIGNGSGLSISQGLVHDSRFNEHAGGAIRVSYPTDEVRIIGTNFDRNQGRGALLLSQRSGSGGKGAVIVRRSVFTNNAHPFGGGAVNVYDTVAESLPMLQERFRTFPPARFVFAYNRFTGNRGRSGGAIFADLSNSQGMAVQGGIFVGNEGVESGGAISVSGRSISVTHSLLRGNRTANRGAAIFGQGREPGATWTVANSLVAENEAPGTGGAIDAGEIGLFNVTLANNKGYGIVRGSGGDPILANLILSANGAGNCLDIGPSSFRGGNLQYGRDDCPNLPVENPYLDEMYVPALGSAALSMGDMTVCASVPVSRTDLAFQSRGSGGTCALGAFEHPPLHRGTHGDRR